MVHYKTGPKTITYVELLEESRRLSELCQRSKAKLESEGLKYVCGEGKTKDDECQIKIMTQLSHSKLGG